MSVLSTARENWRVLALAALLLVSGAAIFVPGLTGGTTQGPTNLAYGLELDGGTRIRAPVAGMTAEVSGQQVNESRVEDVLAARLGVQPDEFNVRNVSGQSGVSYRIELLVGNVSQSEFAAALREAGVEVTAADVREGVTATTREEIVRIIRDKISEAGFGGGRVRQVSTPGGENFIVVELPGRTPAEVRDLLSSRGEVRLVAYHPERQNGTTVYRRTTVLTGEGMEQVGSVEESRRGDFYYVPVVVEEDEAAAFADGMVKYGFGSGTDCRYETSPNDTQPCLLTVVDGEVVYSAGVAPDLGRTFANDEFRKAPQFIIQAPNRSQARQLQINLRAGALPAPLDFDEGTTFTLRPALAQDFKRNSLITGIVAVLAVSGVVFLRYDDVRVAAPMVVTALSEVVLLLGFAAVVQLPLDLSHIAGFIAVIGTGVDDLIIIADEVLSEGEIASARVFQSRFRKAFWVIGAAALTTIVAMSPLAYLSLGDLRGFAIITILGVLIGVLITRPAYGDVLRTLTADH